MSNIVYSGQADRRVRMFSCLQVRLPLSEWYRYARADVYKNHVITKQFARPTPSAACSHHAVMCAASWCRHHRLELCYRRANDSDIMRHDLPGGMVARLSKRKLSSIACNRLIDSIHECEFIRRYPRTLLLLQRRSSAEQSA